MSSPTPPRPPLIALVDRVNRALQVDMVRFAHDRGHREVRQSYNAVFGTLWNHLGGERSVDLAAKAGMTRQSMGEVVRDMVAQGLLEMVPDPKDRRAKLVRYTAGGLALAQEGARYIDALEDRFAEEIGPDYDAARRVLEQVMSLLEEDGPRVDAQTA